MTMKSPLHVTFRSVLGLAGVGAALPLLGCDALSSCGPEAGRDPRRGAGAALARSDDFQPLSCDGAQYPQPLYLMDLAPAEPFDCLELRSYERTQESVGTCSSLGPLSSGDVSSERSKPVALEAAGRRIHQQGRTDLHHDAVEVLEQRRFRHDYGNCVIERAGCLARRKSSVRIESPPDQSNPSAFMLSRLMPVSPAPA